MVPNLGPERLQDTGPSPEAGLPARAAGRGGAAAAGGYALPLRTDPEHPHHAEGALCLQSAGACRRTEGPRKFSAGHLQPVSRRAGAVPERGGDLSPAGGPNH
ncbi:hypothetical protein SDC9_177527 [bioreactor metagenome]|uniref:Uncharacterized protein n=1 Tax=bioreactor metagenome TaxID=1076179 RepID=A0A645GUQ5_9ZZZZ